MKKKTKKQELVARPHYFPQTKGKSTGIPHSIFLIMFPLSQNLSSKTKY